MSGIFNRAIFNDDIFNTVEVAEEAVVLRGGGDRSRRLKRKRQAPFEPIRPEVLVMGRPEAIAVKGRVTVADVEAEIAALMRKQLRTDDENRALRLLLALML